MMNLDSEKIANPCINRLLLNPKGIFVSSRDALYLLYMCRTRGARRGEAEGARVPP